jgi:hypothetical protein
MLRDLDRSELEQLLLTLLSKAEIVPATRSCTVRRRGWNHSITSKVSITSKGQDNVPRIGEQRCPPNWLQLAGSSDLIGLHAIILLVATPCYLIYSWHFAEIQKLNTISKTNSKMACTQW